MAEHRTAEAQVTTDYDQIRKWVESRGGKPAAVKATHRGKDPGIIRLIFPDAPNADDDNLEEIAWDEFFQKFDDANLALLYQDRLSGGGKSLFSKLIGRETAEARRHGGKSRSAAPSRLIPSQCSHKPDRSASLRHPPF